MILSNSIYVIFNVSLVVVECKQQFYPGAFLQIEIWTQASEKSYIFFLLQNKKTLKNIQTSNHNENPTKPNTMYATPE